MRDGVSWRGGVGVERTVVTVFVRVYAIGGDAPIVIFNLLQRLKWMVITMYQSQSWQVSIR